MTPPLKQLLNNALLAIYQIKPLPRNLTESILLYRKLSEIGDIIQYRLGICPVTKRRIGNLRVIFNDKETDPNRSDCTFISNGKSVSEPRTPLETRLKKSLSIDASELYEDEKRIFELKITLLSKDLQKISLARTLADATYFKVKQRDQTIDEMKREVNNRKNEVLKGFKGLFDGGN